MAPHAAAAAVRKSWLTCASIRVDSRASTTLSTSAAGSSIVPSARVRCCSVTFRLASQRFEEGGGQQSSRNGQ